MSLGKKLLIAFFVVSISFIVWQCADIRRVEAEIAARPENVAARAAEKASRDAKKLAYDQGNEMHDATVAMRNSPTPENIARWERAKRAVYGPDWNGSWREDIAQDQDAWANEYAKQQAKQLQKELRDRPVVIVVQSQ